MICREMVSMIGRSFDGGYKGPALYEIRHKVSAERTISLEEIADNIALLINGDIK